ERRAQQLEQQIRSVLGVDEDDLAGTQTTGNRGASQCRREMQVVQFDGMPAPFARALRPGEELLRSRVAAQQLALGIGQENRVADGVDDRKQQPSLALQATVASRMARSHARQLDSEDTCEPRQHPVGSSVLSLDEQQAEHGPLPPHAKRPDMKGSTAERRLRASASGTEPGRSSGARDPGQTIAPLD